MSLKLIWTDVSLAPRVLSYSWATLPDGRVLLAERYMFGRYRSRCVTEHGHPQLHMRPSVDGWLGYGGTIDVARRQAEDRYT